MLDPFSYPTQRTDEIAQGRVMFIAVACGFLLLWSLTFVLQPVILVPGFLYDRSLNAATRLVFMLIEYVFFGANLVLILAGFMWVRHILAAFLLVIGIFSVVLSIALGGYGGALLLLGAMEIVGAWALSLSLGVTRFLEHQKTVGLPWLSLALLTAALNFLVVGLFVFDYVEATLLLHREEKLRADAGDLLQSVATNFDLTPVVAQSEDALRQQLSDPALVAEMQEIKARSGALTRFDGLPTPNMGDVVFYRFVGKSRAFYATATYEKGSVRLSMVENTEGTTPLVTEFYVEPITGK
jgi:hypothetical protein